jgi:hypothetical protein
MAAMLKEPHDRNMPLLLLEANIHLAENLKGRIALHCASKTDAEWLWKKIKTVAYAPSCLMKVCSLVSIISCSDIAEWADDYNNTRPLSSPGAGFRRTMPRSSPQPLQLYAM